MAGLSNKMQRSPDLMAVAVWKGCAWEGRACIVWVRQEAGEGYLGSPARDTCVFVISGLSASQSPRAELLLLLPDLQQPL